MTKEKLISLKKYIESLKDKLTSKVPEKHTHRVKSYHSFLKNEIDTVETQLERLRLEGISEKK